MSPRSLRFALAVLSGVLIGMLLENIVEWALLTPAWRALAYVGLTAAVFVLVVRTYARSRG